MTRQSFAFPCILRVLCGETPLAFIDIGLDL